MDEVRIARKKRKQAGQTLVEYILLVIVTMLFVRFVYYDKNFGFKGVLDKTALRLGSYLEQNVKSGAKLGGDGKASMEPYAGVQRWKN